MTSISAGLDSIMDDAFLSAVAQPYGIDHQLAAPQKAAINRYDREVGRRLGVVRQRRLGLGTQAMAKLLGVSHPTYLGIEEGLTPLDATVIIRLMHDLKIDGPWLLTGTTATEAANDN